ncbi:MAG TPA: YciI family protein [Polyangiaceae bacterium]|nr:YciI family protein [Polyangiaceae bacterium]
MQYVCLFYFDPNLVFNQSAESNAVLAAVGRHNEELRTSGHLVVSQSLTLPNEAVTVQVRDGKMSATDGPFMETTEVLGGFLVIETRDLNEAVSLAARFPLAKLGSVEVRAVVDSSKPRPQP